MPENALDPTLLSEFGFPADAAKDPQLKALLDETHDIIECADFSEACKVSLDSLASELYLQIAGAFDQQPVPAASPSASPASAQVTELDPNATVPLPIAIVTICRLCPNLLDPTENTAYLEVR